MSAICAVSTPLAEGAISVIRISGGSALAVAAKVFEPAGGKSVADMAGYTCAYGYVVDGEGARVDDAVLTVFRAPRAFRCLRLSPPLPRLPAARFCPR